MGWASGSRLCEEVARIVMPKIKKADREKVAKKLIAAFQSHDCDTLDEVDQKDFAKVYDNLYPASEY